jgi:DME family drug/metabolite transporter
VDASQSRGAHAAGVSAILVASLMWGTTGTAASFIPGVPPATIGAAAMGIGGLILGLTAVRGVRRILGTPGALTLVLLGALALAAYTMVFYMGMAWAGVALGNVLALGSAPLFAGLIEWIVDGRRVSGRWVLATAIAVIGGVLLVVGRDHGADRRTLDPGFPADLPPNHVALGIAVALLAGLSYAVYTFVAARLISGRSSALVSAGPQPTSSLSLPSSASASLPASGPTSLAASGSTSLAASGSTSLAASGSASGSTAAEVLASASALSASASSGGLDHRAVISSIQVVAALPLMVYLAFTAGPVIAQPLSWGILLYLAIVPTAIGHSLLAFCLGRMRASTSTVFSLFEPVVAVVLASTIVGEAITPVGWLGLAAVIAGLAILSAPARPTLRR